MMAIVSLLAHYKTYVYVAEVKPGQAVVNMVPLEKGYTPTTAQKEYFINQFLVDTMSLPLDPVLVRKNWLNAYGKFLVQP